MKVAELIKLLRKAPQDSEVVLTYDSFVCVYELNEPEQVFLVQRGGLLDRFTAGQVVIAAMEGSAIRSCAKEEGIDIVPLKVSA